MANVDNKYGFRPYRHIGGGCIRHGLGGTIASAYNTDIFTGDPIRLTGTGRNVEICPAASVPLGFFAGCSYETANGKHVLWSGYWPANTAVKWASAYIFDNDQIVFRVQCDTLAASDIGTTKDWAVAAGNVFTGVSGYTLDVGGVGTTNAKILGLVPEPGNDYGANADAEIQLATSFLATS